MRKKGTEMFGQHHRSPESWCRMMSDKVIAFVESQNRKIGV